MSLLLKSSPAENHESTDRAKSITGCVRMFYLGKFCDMKNKPEETISSTCSEHRSDELFEAFTQTDAFTICKVPAPPNKENAGSSVPLNEIYGMDQSVKRKRQRIKTPKSVMKLMEKHRESERLRHHTLNRQLHLICEKVPGFVVAGKETKVVMMQRIISYIAYLENTMKIICTKLDMTCDSLCFLTNQIRQMRWSDAERKECLSLISEDSRESGVSTLSMSRLLKLSSPTIDSTTDQASRDSRDSIINNDSEAHQEEKIQEDVITISDDESSALMKRTDTEWLMNIDEDDAVIDPENANFNPLLEEAADDHVVFEVPSSLFEVGLMETGEVKWLGSPDKFSFYGPPKTGNGDLNFGIKFDPQLLDETGNEFSHTDIVSPDQVLPQISIKQEINEDFNERQTDGLESIKDYMKREFIEDDENDNQVVPQSFNRRKQSTPKKCSHQDFKLSEFPIEFTDCVSKESDPVICSLSTGNKMVSNVMEVESSNPTESHDQECKFNVSQELARVRDKVLFAARHESASKQDLRRSSWLNGFMMYSCVHRKRFIRENPGIHTAQISKLVGQAWREMTAEDKIPYREKARLCSHELQNILDEKNIV